MRDYLVLGVILGSLPFCLLRPFIGILVWSWVSYMNPHRLAWGLYWFPVAQYVAIPTLIGFFFTKDRQKLPLERETILMLALWLFFTITSFFAFYPDDAWQQWDKVTKIFLITFVTLMLCTDKGKLRYLLLTISFSIGFYGFKGGVFSLLTGGTYRIWGPDGTFIGGNNEIALALLMVIPILYFLAKEEKNRLLKIGLLATFFLSILSVVFTYSRGGFLGLVTVSGLFLLKARQAFNGTVVIVCGALLALTFAPDTWYDRIASIQSYEEDQSAMGRINAWLFGWNLALDSPLTGGGFETAGPETYQRYAPDPSKARDFHSIYFEILGEHGFIGLGLFLSLIGSSLLSLRNLKKMSRSVPSLRWVRDYCDMLELSLAAYITSGAFLGLAYFDLFYHLVAVVVILKFLTKEEYERMQKYGPLAV